jgi:C4-dicarboxylate-specific signal transduction histidine kinase
MPLQPFVDQRVFMSGVIVGNNVDVEIGWVLPPAPRDDRCDFNEAIREMTIFTRGEALKNGVLVEMQLERLPLVQGDRVQLQQVVLNLILNAVETMSSVDGARRELSIRTERRAAAEVLVAVHDSGAELIRNIANVSSTPFTRPSPAE